MKTILFGWELGAGLGHVGPLIRLAQALGEAGHRPVFVLRDVVGPRALLAESDATVMQAPVWPRAASLRGREFSLASYADILSGVGFAGKSDLRAMVAAWDALLAQLRPDLIVADHSPTLCLAALGAIPTALVGNGFTLPPSDRRNFPPLHAERPPAISEERLLESISEVQAGRGRPIPDRLPALLAAGFRAVTCYPELDPYRAVRREALFDPIELMPAPCPPSDPPRIFAYLGAEYPHLDELVQVLVGTNEPLTVYLRDGAGMLRHFLASRGAEVPDRPPPLAEIVPQTSAVISHAGSTIAHAALAGGRPQLLLPMQFEADLTAKSLEAMGVAIRLRTKLEPGDLRKAVHRLTGDRSLRDSAAEWAGLIAERGTKPSLDAVVAGCLDLL